MMRQLTFEGPGRVAWRDAPEPALDSGAAAIVRPRVLGRCDLDVGFVRGMRRWRQASRSATR
jgi:hypothetical protein